MKTETKSCKILWVFLTTSLLKMKGSKTTCHNYKAGLMLTANDPLVLFILRNLDAFNTVISKHKNIRLSSEICCYS